MDFVPCRNSYGGRWENPKGDTNAEMILIISSNVRGRNMSEFQMGDVNFAPPLLLCFVYFEKGVKCLERRFACLYCLP